MAWSLRSGKFRRGEASLARFTLRCILKHLLPCSLLHVDDPVGFVNDLVGQNFKNILQCDHTGYSTVSIDDHCNMLLALLEAEKQVICSNALETF